MASSPAHLVHGMGTELEAPTWPAITPAEAQAALAHFPAAGALVALDWHSPRPFSAATLVRTTQGAFFLKRHHQRLRSLDGLAEEHRFIAHLADAGLSVAQVMLTATGHGAVALGEWCYELHRRAPGDDLYRDRLSWTPFLSDAHAHAAGVALARLHDAAEGFVAPSRRVQPLVASFTILSGPDPLAATRAYVAARPALAAFLEGRAWEDDLARLFALLGQGLSTRLADQPALWTHNDWHPSNLLWTSDGTVATTFDFGLADRTCALHDLATALERTAIAWLDLGHAPDDALASADAARALLAGYASVRPLGAEDVETVVRLLPLVHVEFALSEIDYFSGVLGNASDATLAWDGYLVGHARWFLSRAGQDFLRAVTAPASA
ncbi:phosphotransferase enzyme family protein [Sphingomonas sp. PAMC 26621]|uniref:phosphotransferase enzyme family protein n=1 Tax=Sphingomonas sp. PAMC 26621 TaxID=1112213 RepID=UPI0002882EFB|nr:phosphotransferase [Sphingomonas sp. PAMC 26621]